VFFSVSRYKVYTPVVSVFCLWVCIVPSLSAAAPEGREVWDSDTLVYLQEVEVSGYTPAPFRNQTPASVSVLHHKEMEIQLTTSMVSAMNTATGVRMEERSPGSYRLSIRGSLVRSPYGVRNTKIYYNGFSLTDAGGNTYLNALNVNDLSGVEIIKGPDGSLYGANSGGVVFLQSRPAAASLTRLDLYSGSFGLAGESFQLTRTTGAHQWTVRQSYQRTDGYRRNTRNHRLFVELSDRWQYHRNYSLEGFAFYSDLAYRTPGGLTREQYDEDPRQARPATATLPGSVEQQTGITQRMYFAGVHHRSQPLPWLGHTLSLWTNHVDFIYPFITNYEIRNETSLGLRTFFTLQKEYGDWLPSLHTGVESQRLVTDAYNYDNHAGEKGDIQAYNDIVNTQTFAFVRGKVHWNDRLTLEAAVSLNFNGYHFRDTTHFRNNFDPVWMPHLALHYQACPSVGLRFTVSRGYSTPTTAEVRPSDNKIYRDLQAEKGWNTEGGVRLRLADGRFSADASVFHYRMNDGIISQVDDTSNTYFVNASRIRQLGAECSTSWFLVPYDARNRVVKSLRWNSSYTWSQFRYDTYITADTDHSGNRVAGVPRTVWVNSLNMQLPAQLYVFVQHNYTGRIPLNDANSVWADKYHLLSAQVGMYLKKGSYLPRRIYVTADNLLGEKYSLGNDLNAAGNRYYNAAPTRNVQAGAVWEF